MDERKSRSDVIGELIVVHQYKCIAEIGLSRGDNARGIKKYLKDHNYRIDLFYGIDPGEWGLTNKLFRPNMEFLSLWSAFRYIKDTSDQAINEIKMPLDLVFVDGDHTPSQIEKDIIGYTKIICDGGCLVGDDYNDHVGVGIKKVVNSIIGSNNINIQLDTRLESGKDNCLWWTYVQGQQYKKELK